MSIHIQRGSPVPISRQIDAQLRAQILSGSLRPEEQLPSVRQLARDLAVNVNTVFRVYEHLAADGLIELRHGDGTYVAPRRKSASAAQLALRLREFEAELEALIRRAFMLGISVEDLPMLLSKSIERVHRDTASGKLPTRKTEAT